MKFADWAYRARVPLGFVLGIAFLVLAKPTPRTLFIGAIIAFLGLAMRAWAAGHIVKNDRLATTGPYAHTRNPLYFGSFLLACGFALAAHWGFVLVVAAFFLVIYVPTMMRERHYIAGLFPEEYAEWEANVPAFVPRPTPWVRGQAAGGGAFSSALYARHGEWKAAVGYAAVLGWLWLRATGRL